MIEMTAATPCADCPHARGMHYRSYDGEIVGCAACECDGFMLTPSKPQEPVPDDWGLVERGMTIFRLIAARRKAESERDALAREVGALRAALAAFVQHHDDGQTGQPGYPRTYGELDVWQAEWDQRYAALRAALAGGRSDAAGDGAS